MRQNKKKHTYYKHNVNMTNINKTCWEFDLLINSYKVFLQRHYLVI